jgi:mannonate dehydratase
MRITDAKVLVTCPGRNFVTLKLTTRTGSPASATRP